MPQVNDRKPVDGQDAARELSERTHRSSHATEPLLYSVEEAAAILGIGRTFMFRLVGTGEIESCKIGKLRKITRVAIQDYIARLVRQQAAEVAPELGHDSGDAVEVGR